MVELPTATVLRAHDVVLIAVIMFAIDLTMKIWNSRRLQLSPVEQKLLNEYNTQVRLVNRLNSVETFVEQAKATRKLNSLKKEMQELAGEERLAASAPSNFRKQFDRIRTPALMGLVMLYYWNEPLVVLPQGCMIPVERFMSFPGFPLGAISAIGWVGICRRVSAKILC
ncbi:uncharacterized protein PHALS_01961 [Plasmopara halstedii]|uniref:Tail-anchored protein insertion receptor WRB n=1 Tax=Plasmopara halstedii TaxID=4781 RepID=A0A0P1AVA4_PLAHL|nr:uncharacterized protein PHALS_01961 [Plasmopara halstedii]CEG45678.1 hypothetical protein PHALS_01961 [Plasmopara halstedii]|eukprot:XP_024582047.1 hypothetical protein PHALS_01961 [Plasmopara halstedii]